MEWQANSHQVDFSTWQELSRIVGSRDFPRKVPVIVSVADTSPRDLLLLLLLYATSKGKLYACMRLSVAGFFLKERHLLPPCCSRLDPRSRNLKLQLQFCQQTCSS